MTYVGIGLNHPLEVEGQIFISNTETTNVPFEIYSNYSDKKSLIDSRQLRLRVNTSEIPGSTSHIDMGIDNTTGNYFYISQPVYDSTISGNKDTFKIDNQGSVSINVKNYNADDIYGNLISSSNMIIDETDIVTSNLTISTGVSFDFNYSNVVTSTPLSIEKVYISSKLIFGTIYVTSVLVITTDGSVYGCGDNEDGQLGTGNKVSTKFFVKGLGEGTSGVVKLATSESATITLKNNGKIYYSGRGITGISTSLVFKEITSINNVLDVVLNDSFALFLKSDGSVYGIGSNSYRAMGIGNQSSVSTPTLLINGASDVSAIAASPKSTAIIKNNAVYTCGYNEYGELGISSVPVGTFITTHQLTDGEGTSGVDQVAFNENLYRGKVLYIRKGGAIYSTGDNYWGQLGIGTSGPGTNRTTFTAAIGEGASNVNELLLSGRIIKNDNKIYYTGGDADSNAVRFTQIKFDGPVSDYSLGPGDIDNRTEAIVSESNIFIRYVSPFYGTPSYATTFTEVPGIVPPEITIAEINNTNHGNPVIKFNSTEYQDDYGAFLGLHETASSNLMRMGVITTNPTNYVTVNEDGTMSASSFLSFKGMHGAISSNVIEKDLIVSVDTTSSPIINSVNDILTNVKLSDIENDPNVFGVSNGDGHYNAVGNGTVWVTNENGTFTSGDYITSSTLSGYGVKQLDDTQMNYTVAKILQNCDFTNAKRFLSMSEDKTLSTITKE